MQGMRIGGLVAAGAAEKRAKEKGTLAGVPDSLNGVCANQSPKTIITNGHTYVNLKVLKVRIKQGFFEAFPTL